MHRNLKSQQLAAITLKLLLHLMMQHLLTKLLTKRFLANASDHEALVLFNATEAVTITQAANISNTTPITPMKYFWYLCKWGRKRRWVSIIDKNENQPNATAGTKTPKAVF